MCVYCCVCVCVCVCVCMRLCILPCSLASDPPRPRPHPYRSSRPSLQRCICNFKICQQNSLLLLMHNHGEVLLSVETYDSHYLCETEEESTLPRWRMYAMGQKITLPTPTNSSLRVPTVTCPDEHVTYTFFACDVKANCWSDSLKTRSHIETV